MELRDVHGLTWKTWNVATAEGDTAMYTDAAAFMLMNKASIDDLNSRLDVTDLSQTYHSDQIY